MARPAAARPDARDVRREPHHLRRSTSPAPSSASVWRIGTGEDAVVVEVTAPRIPCQTFSALASTSPAGSSGSPTTVRRAPTCGWPAAGPVRAGDPIEVRRTGRTTASRIADVFPTVRPEQAPALIAAHDSGAVQVVAELYDAAARAAAARRPAAAARSSRAVGWSVARADDLSPSGSSTARSSAVSSMSAAAAFSSSQRTRLVPGIGTTGMPEPRALAQHPGQGDLRRRHVVLLGDLGGGVGDRLVGLARPHRRSAGCARGSPCPPTTSRSTVPVRKPRPSGE